MKIEDIIDTNRRYSVDDLFSLLFWYIAFVFIIRTIILSLALFWHLRPLAETAISSIFVIVFEFFVVFLSKKFRFRKIWWFVFVLNFFECFSLGSLVGIALPFFILTVPIYRLLGSESAPLIRNKFENILSTALKWLYKIIYYVSAAVIVGGIFLLWLTRVNHAYRAINFESVAFWCYISFSYLVKASFVLMAFAQTAKIEKDRITEVQQTNEN